MLVHIMPLKVRDLTSTSCYTAMSVPLIATSPCTEAAKTLINHQEVSGMPVACLEPADLVGRKATSVPKLGTHSNCCISRFERM